MADLKYMVIQYIPELMDGFKESKALIDGHYAEKAEAIEVAKLWADQPSPFFAASGNGDRSRIIVVEVVHSEMNPRHWSE